MLYGIAPVHQCLLWEKRTFIQLFIKKKSSSPRVKEILKLAEKRKVPIQYTDGHQLSQKTGNKHHQGVLLECGDLQTLELDQWLNSVSDKEHALLIALDQVEDPQNVGAITRSAAFLKADGILVLRDKAAPLSAAVSKASAGALEYFPVIQVTNLADALERLKKNGFFVAGAVRDEDSVDFGEAVKAEKMALVLGNEGQGLRKLTRKRCDYLVHIPGDERAESLNVSAAAAILIQHFVQCFVRNT